MKGITFWFMHTCQMFAEMLKTINVLYTGQQQVNCRPNMKILNHKLRYFAGMLCGSAIQLARDTADLKYMIEQPCKSIRDCRDVRNSASVPMIQDETMVDIPAILQAYHEGAIDMVKLKISRLGGLTRTRQVDLSSTSLGYCAFC